MFSFFNHFVDLDNLLTTVFVESLLTAAFPHWLLTQLSLEKHQWSPWSTLQLSTYL